jgi:hypothetical protein
VDDSIIAPISRAEPSCGAVSAVVCMDLDRVGHLDTGASVTSD